VFFFFFFFKELKLFLQKINLVALFGQF